jgi:hypothetical protein
VTILAAMAWLTEQQIHALDPAALKAYALTLQTPLSAAFGEIAALTELDSTEFANLPNIDPKKAVAAIQVCVKIANVRTLSGNRSESSLMPWGVFWYPGFRKRLGLPPTIRSSGPR